MHNVRHAVIVPYHAKQIYALVNDVPAYPEFIPNCVNSNIIRQQENEMIAFIEVEKMGMRKRITTRNTLSEPSSIFMELIDGPVSQLTGKWSFTEQDNDHCRIEFNLKFKFNNKLIEKIFCHVLEMLVVDMVNAFKQRAHYVYRQQQKAINEN